MLDQPARALGQAQAQHQESDGDHAGRRDDDPPHRRIARAVEQSDRHDGTDEHAERLQRDGGDDHPAAHTPRCDFGYVRSTGGKIDADSHPDQELAQEDQGRIAGDGAQSCAGGEDPHIHEEGRLAPEAVGGRASEQRPDRSAEHERRPEETHHYRANVQVAGDQRQRRAEREDRETIDQGSAGGEEPQPIAHSAHRRLV